jgi:hypothetical protein
MADVSRDNEDRSINAHDGGAVLSHTESPAKYAIPLCIIACAFAISAFIYAALMHSLFDDRMALLQQELKDTKTQAWLTERRYMDAEAVLLREGFLKPGDKEYGPAANLNYSKEKQHGR